MRSSTKKDINRRLHAISVTYHTGIPLHIIFGVLRDYEILALQEDHTEWSGLLVGEKADNVSFELAHMDSKYGHRQYIPYSNTLLVISWYKMNTGRYEVIAYVS
jgi:hypothetical protein